MKKIFFSVAAATFLALASQQALAAEPETVSEQEGVSNADVTPFETVDAQSTVWIWSRGITNVTDTRKTAYSNYYHRDSPHRSAAQLGNDRAVSPLGGPGATTYASIRGNKNLPATFYRFTY
ncbi:BH0279 [Halalkalibacterium halodurans C-125]|uniref:BH0279 protein n=1 Tax=Halalkalibacterium halodurans (strain ATCC BAA-125 / DSM 18197 / FERM 7344 / JCM 9153 / C-125) TaxID=272558 RepID=Q9KG36_HALH5|nr:lactococcin 972 family bacteriocin [Halalkalibacterium halodurans]BAB03998.1 BH0279 [Halalkalibacterium halodurans C-125]